MAILVSSPSVVFLTCGVWLGLRIGNRRQRWLNGIGAAAIAFAVNCASAGGLTEQSSQGERAELAPAALPPRALVRFGTDNLRTQGFIQHLAFSPDGKRIAAVEANAPWPTIVLFDVDSGRPVQRLDVREATRSRTSRIAFSPNGARLLWGESDGHVAVWNLADDRLVFRDKLHAAEVTDVLYSPRGDVVATCSSDGDIGLRRADDLTEPVRLMTVGDVERQVGGKRPPGANNFNGPVRPDGYVLAFTPAGEQLIIGSKSNAQISLWNVADGEFQRIVEFAHGAGKEAMNPSLNRLVVTPDGTRIMSAGQQTFPREQTKIEWGSKNVTISQVRFWDLKTGQRTPVVYGEEDYGFGLAALSPDGKQIAVGDFGRLNFWNVASAERVATITLPGWWGKQPVYSPAGTLIAVPIDNAIGLFEVATRKRLHHAPQTPVGGVQACSWSAAGDRIVTSHHDGFVRVWNAASGELIWVRESAPAIAPGGRNSSPAFVAFTPDGETIVMAGSKDDRSAYRNGLVVVCDAATGNTQREMSLKTIRNGALGRDGKTVVAATSFGGIGETRLHGFDVATGRKLFVAPPEDQKIGLWDAKVMRFRPDSQTLLVATGGGDIIQFDAVTGQERRRTLADYRTPEQKQTGRPREPQLWSGAFSDDGRTLVSCSEAWVYVWDADTGDLRLTIRHPHDHGCNLCLAPDGKTLVTADINYVGDRGADTIRVYDLGTGDLGRGQELFVLEPSDSRAQEMTFSPDGTRLFTGFARGSAIIWDVRRP